MRTAKGWGLTPRQWREQSPDDRALMLALDMFESTREGYREEFREARRKQSGKQNHGENEFDTMKKHMRLRD